MKKGIIAILSGVLGAVGGFMGSQYMQSKKTSGYSKEKKFRDYYNVLNQWLLLKNKGIGLDKYFADNNIKSIAIYGMGELGERLYEELKSTNIEVKYGIDKMGGINNNNFEVFSLEDDLEEVDAIIVTAMFAFDEIEMSLSQKLTCLILSLEDVVFNIEV